MTKLNIKSATLFLICCSFFIGIWHAFPMLNVINDEMYYVGGVLRAIENHTVIPAVDDVPYGTVTYILNYAMTIFTLVLSLVFFKFDIVSLKTYLIQNPSVMYLSLRVLSGLFSLCILYIVNKLLKKIVNDEKSRLFLIIILFTNIITAVLMHTGKMWVLSLLLVIASFYFLYKALLEEELNRSMFLSILFSFLAVANFPLNIFSLINIPILFYNFRGRKDVLKKLFLYTLIGSVIFLVLTILNLSSIKNQVVSIFTDYHPLVAGNDNSGGFFKSFFAYTYKLILLFPLFICTLILLVRDRIFSKKLFIISVLYFFAYFFAIVFVADWATDTKTYLRYLFPLGFFFTFILASYNFKFTSKFYLITVISVVYFVFTIYYLSVPTTYNLAFDWVNTELNKSGVLIVNEVPELQLIKNKDSAILVNEKACSTKCNNIISLDLNKNIYYTVLDGESVEISSTKKFKEIYYISREEKVDSSLKLVKQYTNKSKDYHSVDYNIGSYFELDYLKISNLGKNIYIYASNK